MTARARHLDWWWIAAIVLVAAACTAAQEARSGDVPTPVPANPVESTTPLGPPDQNAFSNTLGGLTSEERELADIGDIFFQTRWAPFPSQSELQDGLGPIFNSDSCANCHLNNGRGEGPIGPQDTIAVGLFARVSLPGISQVGGPAPHPTYGLQLQNRSISGVPPEGRLQVTFSPVEGTYGDGTRYVLQAPTYELVDLGFGPLGDDALVGPRLAQQLVGMGLLEAVPEATIRALADPEDADGDGISGRPNEVWNPRTEATELGRFGWKANDATVEAQVAGAFAGDIGITSPLHPEARCGDEQRSCQRASEGFEPEISDEILAAVTLHTSTRAVPKPRGEGDASAQRGAELFRSFGCASCHVETLETGDHPISAVSNQTIHPFTDLLLHDMGPGLADNRPDFLASGSEWRTPPLWGIGRIDEVGRRQSLLHDGRARSFEEAILWHGGEGQAAMEAFRTATAQERADLVRFLDSL